VKDNIHPTWFPNAVVTCACGNTWTTGATVAELRTDICSRCHPFYTGEQRIVDTEGQVDRFMKRLQVLNDRRQKQEATEAAKTPANLSIAELGIEKRYVNLLAENNLETAGDFIARLEQGGDEAVLEIPGIGRKVLSDVKRALRSRGYELPAAKTEEPAQ
jgi:large subunit ribosomal protein L31